MMRPPFPGHRRYSITHRAVQRLRELVPNRDEEDDERLRDRLDEALAAAEDAGKAIRTLDAMLGEPQTLVPVDTFGDVLFAIIKEDTVVTVLPEGHGQEILQRGQAMEQKVAAGHVPPPRGGPGMGGANPSNEVEGGPRRRWRKEPQPVVIQRARGGQPPSRNGHAAAIETAPGREAPPPTIVSVAHKSPLSAAPLPPADGAVAEEIRHALDRGRRRAVVAALAEVLGQTDREDSLLPLWNALANQGVPNTLTVGDLIDAVRSLPQQ